MSSEHSAGAAAADAGLAEHSVNGTEHPAPAPTVVRFASPPRDDMDVDKAQPSFRLRTARLGRMFLDRRGILHLRSKPPADPKIAERFKYALEDEDDEDTARRSRVRSRLILI